MKLATAEVITKITPIQGAQNIVCATLLGWEIVVKLDEYKVGDLVSYIQIDTVVPEITEYEFLRSRKFRVRTIKLMSQISQGLIVPLPKGNWKEGDDLTEFLGIKKWERVDSNPITYDIPKMPKIWWKKWIYILLWKYVYPMFPKLQPGRKSKFPSHLVSITDETRIQNMPSVLEKYNGQVFIVTAKMDGSSVTIIHSKHLWKSKFRICSRRLELHGTNNDWYRTFKDNEFDKEILKLVSHYKTNNIIVQGEAIGKFNGNHHNLLKNEIRLFNIFVDGRQLLPVEYILTCVSLSIPHCPYFNTITLNNHTVKDVLQISEIPDVLNPKVDAEGLVWRCVDDGLSFKAINNKYLIKEK